jgi:hypothetical protein
MSMRSPVETNQPVDSWRVVGASVRGLSHIKADLPCQDAHVWRDLPGGAIVLAVADGAGSASLSQLGAARAAVAATEWVSELMKQSWPRDDDEWHGLLLATLETAHDAVKVAAKKRKAPPRELASTLIVLVATHNLVAAAQVGDGGAVVLRRDGHLYSLTAPTRGEFVNETIFCTSDNYLKAAQFSVWRGEVAGVAALSDGLQHLALKLPDNAPHAAFFTPLFRLSAESPDPRSAEKQLRDFMQSDRITSRADDDLTLVIGTLAKP